MQVLRGKRPLTLILRPLQREKEGAGAATRIPCILFLSPVCPTDAATDDEMIPICSARLFGHSLSLLLAAARFVPRYKCCCRRRAGGGGLLRLLVRMLHVLARCPMPSHKIAFFSFLRSLNYHCSGQKKEPTHSLLVIECSSTRIVER